MAYMPFSLFISRWLSLYTGGLGIWDASKDILTLILLAISAIIGWKLGLYKNKLIALFFALAGLYGLMHVIFIIFKHGELDFRPSIVGTLYNGRIVAYAFIGLVAGLSAKHISRHKIIKLILVVSTLTCVFALLQYVLPKDLMTHFGYSIERGAKPSFFIDDKPDFPRVMSTLRDPNSYGAYLILPICILWAMLLKRAAPLKKLAPLLALHLGVLFLTFSRGAWIGAIAALGFMTFYLYKVQLKLILKKRAWVLLVPALALIPLVYIVKDTYTFRNVILHSDEATLQADPNELRIQLQTKALRDIADEPLGHGPGTAGLASIGNKKNGTFLTENYFLQIGYEVGFFGLIIFLSIMAALGFMIRLIKDPLAKAILFATFIGYWLISLLIHLWSNEAVAAQWWLLAGMLAGQHINKQSI